MQVEEPQAETDEVGEEKEKSLSPEMKQIINGIITDCLGDLEHGDEQDVSEEEKVCVTRAYKPGCREWNRVREDSGLEVKDC